MGIALTSMRWLRGRFQRPSTPKAFPRKIRARRPCWLQNLCETRPASMHLEYLTLRERAISRAVSSLMAAVAAVVAARHNRQPLGALLKVARGSWAYRGHLRSLFALVTAGFTSSQGV